MYLKDNAFEVSGFKPARNSVFKNIPIAREFCRVEANSENDFFQRQEEFGRNICCSVRVRIDRDGCAHDFRNSSTSIEWVTVILDSDSLRASSMSVPTS